MRFLLVVTLLSLPTWAARDLTISVLYFDNDTGTPELEPLKKGLADMLTTDLAQLPGVSVVERDRLQTILEEQRLTRSRFFDPTSAVAAGKLLGATHVVTGSMTAADPQLRLDIRLIDVRTGKVIVTGQVTGPSGNLLELEQQLVRRFASGLAVPEKGLVTGKASLAALLAYSRGLDAVDQGDLESARSSWSSSAQSAPDFVLVRQRYAELLARLEAAKTSRSAALSEDERLFRQHAAEWTRINLATATPEQHAYSLGYGLASLRLAFHRLSQLVGESRSEPVVVPRSKRAELSRLETEILDLATELGPKLRNVRRVGVRLYPDDQRRLLALLDGKQVLDWMDSEEEVSSTVARLLLLGSEHHETVLYRPTALQRSPERAERWLAMLDLARQDPSASYEVWLTTDDGAEALVLLGQREAAIARWQHFIDAAPTDPHFQDARAKIEALLLVSPDVVSAVAQLNACKREATATVHPLMRAVARAEGRPGLERLLKKVEACAPKQGSLAMGFRMNGYSAAAQQALGLGDCELFLSLRKKMSSEEPLSVSGLNMINHRCDEP